MEYKVNEQSKNVLLKGQCHEIFASGFFMNQFSPRPRVSHKDCFKFFRKFAEIFASQGAPPVSTTSVANLPLVSTTQAANFATSFASFVTGGKFATSVNNTSFKLGHRQQFTAGINDFGGKFATEVNDTGGK